MPTCTYEQEHDVMLIQVSFSDYTLRVKTKMVGNGHNLIQSGSIFHLKGKREKSTCIIWELFTKGIHGNLNEQIYPRPAVI